MGTIFYLNSGRQIPVFIGLFKLGVVGGILQNCCDININTMDSLFSENLQRGRSRNRCYSSMNYQEYEDFFGEPPKMPNAPQPKPLQDPLDIPLLSLEQQVTDAREPLQIREMRKIRYKIETIPEIEGSEDNSIAFCSPKKNYQIFLTKPSAKLEQDGEEMQTIASGPRKRNRPRSYSENSPLNTHLRIIDFLKESNSKYMLINARGRKMVKIQ